MPTAYGLHVKLNISVDVDECHNTGYMCGDKSSGNCTNTVGSYSCECLPGYYRRDFTDLLLLRVHQDFTDYVVVCDGKQQCQRIEN